MTVPSRGAPGAAERGWPAGPDGEDDELAGPHAGASVRNLWARRRSGTATAPEQPAWWGSGDSAGSPDRNGQRSGGEAGRNGGGTERNDGGTAGRNDARAERGDPDAAAGHAGVPVDADGDRNGDRNGDRADAGAGERRSLVDRFRFVNDGVDSLRKQLRFAQTACYNGCDIPVVRAANVAFFWMVTAPAFTVGFFLLWAFAALLHRALTGAGIVVAIAPFVNRLAPWLVPDILDATTWTGVLWEVAFSADENATAWTVTMWHVVGVAGLAFGICTAIALAAGRQR